MQKKSKKLGIEINEIENIIETKADSLKRLTELMNINQEKQSKQITNIKNEKRDITIITTNIKRSQKI